MKKYIVALDEGTTSTRAVLFDIESQKIVMQKSSPIEQIYPETSFVEENANEIYAETLSSLVEILENADDIRSVAGIGITNQRETVIAWDKETGKPLYNAIVWQCRRTAEYMRNLGETHGEFLRKKTGLLPDAYFSASKIKWLIDNVPIIRERLKEDKVRFGTVDSFLVYKLTGGKAFVTDVTNASRTMLVNLKTLDYDDELLSLFGIPRSALPEIVACDEIVGEFNYDGVSIPICGIAGDQQAALIGQRCFNAGDIKATYGTGLFALCNIGEKPEISGGKLLMTVGYKIGDKTVYAYEGSVFNAGSAIQFLRDNLGFFSSSGESEILARSVNDNGGVYFVPAFTGLGAPHWDQYARGTIVGITRGVNKNHIIRATMESLAYQVNDILVAMQADSGIKLAALNVDGGASANNLLMQMQSDISGAPVQRPTCVETTAMGAAYLAGLAVGYWASKEDVVHNRAIDRVFHPEITAEDRAAKVKGWNKAVKCAYGWAKDE